MKTFKTRLFVLLAVLIPMLTANCNDKKVDAKADMDKTAEATAEAELEQEPDSNSSESADLSSMTKAQLIDYAESNGITINKSAKKAAILNTIEEAKI